MSADLQSEMAAAAAQLVETLVANAARRYEKRPALLDLISLGLSDASPERIIATCEAKFEQTSIARFGDEVMPVNLKGAIVYARRQMEAA